MNKKIIYLINSIIILAVIFGLHFLLDTTNASNLSTSSVQVGNNAPTVNCSTHGLNEGANITLVANSTKTVYLACTITDANTASDISSATGTLYWSGVSGGSACASDNNTCYHKDTACILGDPSGNNRDATCTFDLYFHATPTPIAAQYWTGEMRAFDLQGASSTATNTGQTVDIGELQGVDVTAATNYGTVAPGAISEDPMTTDEVVATTTGNIAIDSTIAGTWLDSGTNQFAESYQHFASSSGVAYAAGAALSSSTPIFIEFTSNKPTTNPSNATSSIFCAIQVPVGTATGTYNATTTFTIENDSNH